MVWGDYLSFESGRPVKDRNSKDDGVPVFGANGQIGTSHLPPLCKIPSFIVGRVGRRRGVYYSSVPFSATETAFYALPLTDEIDLKWAYYKFQTYDIDRIISGSATPTVIRNELQQIPVVVPPLDIQRKTVSVLDCLDRLISVNAKICDRIFQQTQSLVRSRFIDLQPFNGAIPSGWHWGTVSEIAEYHDTKRAPLSERDRKSLAKTYPYYGASSIVDYVDRYLFDGIYLLLGEDGTVTDREGHPVLQYVDGKFWVNNHAHILSGKNGFSTELLYLLLSITNVAAFVTGAVQPKISQSNLNRVPVLIPSDEELSKMDEQIQPMFARLRDMRTKNRRLAAIRDDLLSKLMSGELDVSNVSINVPIGTDDLSELRQIIITKKKAEKTMNLDSVLFRCKDILRQARNSGSFFFKRDLMLTLVFLRFIGEKYEICVDNLHRKLVEKGLPHDEPDIQAALTDGHTFADGTFLLLPEARWLTIINTPAARLNEVLDAALRSIAANITPLKDCIEEGTFAARNLAPSDIKKLVDEVNKISHKSFGEEKDLIGRVYEYFLKEFAVNATKEEGEYYTPHDVVQLITAMIEPFDGTLYDPCCGSGGMFIQSAALVKARQGEGNRISVYGQEKEPATYRLAKMNLSLRGIGYDLGDKADSVFANDLHQGRYFDYVMANPPFNLKNWYDEELKNDPRWADYGTPPEGNANYAWILHILSHLEPKGGVAGFLLTNGALNDGTAAEIRERLIRNDKVEAIIVLPRELFITTDISVTLWILNQNKKGGDYHGRSLRSREHEILFMDLRTWTENPAKNENKKKIRLTTEQIGRAAEIYHKWQSEGVDGNHYEAPELYRSVGIAEIERNGWSLVPSRYIGFIDRDLELDFPAEMRRIQQEMREITAQEKEAQKMLEEALRGIGYGID